MKLIILASAQMELEQAREYYDQRANARVAEAFLNQFEHAVRLLIVNAIAHQRRRPGYWAKTALTSHYPTRRISDTPAGMSASFTVTL